MKKFAISTLGCKVNQYESSFIKESLEKSGFLYVPFNSVADIYIVNTCSVTSKASFQSRQLLRRAKKLNPEATIAAIGCYSQVEAEELSRLQTSTHILGTAEKSNIVDFLMVPGIFSNPFTKVSGTRNCKLFTPQPIDKFSEHTRAFLKIQDGCDAYCSYCIIPYSRGGSRSLPCEDIQNQVERFLRQGYKEIVLTGIHLGKWGNDFTPSLSLYFLLDKIGQALTSCRLRLSSIEPLELTEEILNLIARQSQFCPHLHVPLQSAAPDVLKRMNRPYSPEEYEERFWKSYKLIPDLAWGADIIAGFPGETREDFLKTYVFIEKLPLAYIHVFPFSPRPNTPAANFPKQVEGSEKNKRTALLRKLGIKKRKEFYSRFIGKRLEILVESENKTHRGLYQGFSPNYLRVLFPGSSNNINKRIMVKPEKYSAGSLLGVSV